MIREQDPLKQGLKLVGNINGSVEDLIREQDPLKQGLKLLCHHIPIRYLLKFVSKIH